MAGKKREFGFEVLDFGFGGREPGARSRLADAGLEKGTPGEQSTLPGPYGPLAGRLELVRRRKLACLAQAPSSERRRR